MPDAPGELSPITRSYLLCLNITCYRDDRGVHYFDPLWHKDLIQHARYLKDLTLASPCRPGEPPPDAMAWTPSLPPIQFVDLPLSNNTLQAILHLPSTAVRLWAAIGRAGIVHLGLTGWPIPFAWVASPFAALRSKFSVVIVESAPWRLRPGLPVNWKTRVRAKLFETLGRWCVNRSNLVIMTQEEYRRSLLTARPDRAHIIHASWLDEELILSPAEAEASWASKRLASGGPTLKLLFAGRLERSKGVLLMLDAIPLAVREGVPVELNILGRGELESECRRACERLQGVAKVSMLGVAPYDSSFFAILRSHHAVVVPSLSDEQPRIVYDAFSQAVPVLASDTPGLRDCVRHGSTGRLITGGPSNWAAQIKWCFEHPNELERMGRTGLETARWMTHEEMHRRRWRLLVEMLEGRPG